VLGVVAGGEDDDRLDGEVAGQGDGVCAQRGYGQDDDAHKVPGQRRSFQAASATQQGRISGGFGRERHARRLCSSPL
jgi:hypothetical protein